MIYDDKRTEITIKGYLKQDDRELAVFKQKLLLTIAQSDLRYINLCKLQYELDDILFRLE